MAHPLYQTLIKEIEEVIYGRQNILLASGHEHNLQYFYEKNNHFVKSGSGSKSSPLPKKTEAIFSDASKGYAKVEYYKNGEVRLIYYTITDHQEVEKFNELIAEAEPTFGSFKSANSINTKPVQLNASDLYKKGGLHTFIFGKLYREDWETPVSFRGIDLSKEKGGLKPRKIGGGRAVNPFD